MDELNTCLKSLGVGMFQFGIAVTTAVKVTPSAAGGWPADLQMGIPSALYHLLCHNSGSTI